MKNWSKIPYVLALITPWALFKANHVNTSLTSVVGGLLLVASVLVLAMEFFRSGDIGLRAFGIDTAFSVVQLIACTAVITVLCVSSTARITLPDMMVCVVVLLDAWFSPFNSFRTALRNWTAQAAGPASPGNS